ncbi:hypothetical protein SAMN04488589_0907 [Methanolobus vulcani]|uniref:Uncharacterized protein n=1 Tax=Methanolobus vulcani TaxID=38026 RepID=A0A7Z7AWH3_9EURY|nr:hypothetical protein [Methanolobus vulcani]MDK2825335.1 hypothetical protein [Methanolobus sp.]MDK2946938.1 hypothetical protein [Methanolobus sp.]SDF56904.1 hypothetical protein SAMN04488589_0907 [Methanolobus vulcani]
MESMRYMSLVFRGLVEEYNNTGVRPSVFMDESGSLQVYLCDPIIEEMDEDYGIDIEREYDVNGGQFSDAHFNRVMPVETIRHNLGNEATIQ